MHKLREREAALAVCGRRAQDRAGLLWRIFFYFELHHSAHCSFALPQNEYLQEEYRREGLSFKRVDFVNNDATVALLDGNGGILRTLEDVCRFESFLAMF